MKITYIHHSSFSVELDNCILLFDYFKGKLPKWDKNKKIYIFSSHQHHDHFDPIIFNIEKEYPDVTYILSDDIKNTQSDNTVFVKPNQSLSIDRLDIKTLESTDLGVAFIVKAEGKRFYHAGDLNYWHWENENSDEENHSAGLRYQKEINKIKNLDFDVAFIPLDPRQGLQYNLGFDSFMRTVNTKYAFPMHFWRTYSTINLLLSNNCSEEYRDKIVKISKEPEEFIID
ncbi:MAG: MBL fold metallo-hydrolase [Peptostreptococcaceae bacterium]